MPPPDRAWAFLVVPAAVMGLAEIGVLATRHDAVPASSAREVHSAPASNDGAICLKNSDCTGRLVCLNHAPDESRCGLYAQSPNPPPRDPRANLCPHAAKRLLDKMYGCGFNTDGLTEPGLCERMVYDQIAAISALNCRELSSALH